jgi:hypothetical protein
MKEWLGIHVRNGEYSRYLNTETSRRKRELTQKLREVGLRGFMSVVPNVESLSM